MRRPVSLRASVCHQRLIQSAAVGGHRRSELVANRLRRHRRNKERRRAAANAGPAWNFKPVAGDPGDEGSRETRVPDILHESPLPWGDLSGSAELVRFAFEGGDCAGIFDALVEATPLSSTSFREESFASQLFLDQLVKACFSIEVDEQEFPVHDRLLIRQLSTPPAELADVHTRQDVLQALSSHKSLRGDLERVYVALRSLTASLEASPAESSDAVRRKIEVLLALKDSIDALADGFEGADNALGRLNETGALMRDSDAYRQLAELLDLDDHMATVDVRLRLGADGRIRGFGVMQVRENLANAMLPGGVRRFFQRLLGFLRGYRYSEHEVVIRLLDQVFSPLVDDIVTCLALTGGVELYLAALSFSDTAQDKGLAVCLPELQPPPHVDDEEVPEISYEALFNPLLWLQDIVPTPCDLAFDRSDALVIITGPNSGGKTRLLQAISIAQLLGQVGLFVPAAAAKLVQAPSMFVSLVVEADAAQVEGRLGTELLRVRRLFEELEPGALAILDELCSGTNPQEGEAIFELVVELLPRLRPQVFISTHFLGLAKRLAADRPVENLAFLEVDLDEDERPTYAFISGVAKTSLAHKVAARLGVTREELEGLVEDKLTE